MLICMGMLLFWLEAPWWVWVGYGWAVICAFNEYRPSW